MENWIEIAVGRMHTNKISNIALAKHLGISAEYVSEILNGRKIKNGKGTKEKILTAIDEIIANKG